MTGFRVGLGGAQAHYARALPGFAPDLSVFGKVIGGGMPLAAFGASRDIMSQLAPLGPVYQAGTLSGNPVAMAAGLATLRETARPGFYETLEQRTARLLEGATAALNARGVPCSAGHAGSMWGCYLAGGPVRTYEDAKQTDTKLFARWHKAALGRGVFLAPSAFEAGFVSSAHSDADIEVTIKELDAALDDALRG